MSGGIPRKHRSKSLSWLNAHRDAEHSLDAAHLLTIAVLLGHSSDPWVDWLLELQCPDGLWPASPKLLVPAQEGETPGSEVSPGHCDSERILGSAMVLMALKLWLHAAETRDSVSGVSAFRAGAVELPA